jgi:hydroxymethylpyrimidine pyrophosphatase-like HAD family hydrolase
MQIAAILSDYDGTLSPTDSIRSKENAIPEGLENVLWDISEKIPVCIVSSKDFNFLHKRTRFAKIISCILGIETLVLERHKKTGVIPTYSEDKSGRILECQDFSCIKNNYISVSDDDDSLRHNSGILSQLVEQIGSDFKGVSIEEKFTVTGKEALAGITIDWRHMDDWKSFKVESEPRLRKVITEKQREFPQSNIHIQTYTTHPFVDIYTAKCDKGMAFDRITSEIPTIEAKRQNIMYLGDSENDNPGFRKANVSIGIQSDSRLRPKLNCKYNICFNELPVFLKNLLDRDLEFSDSLFS